METAEVPRGPGQVSGDRDPGEDPAEPGGHQHASG